MTQRDLSYLGLDTTITGMVELHPIEDIALHAIRDRFPEGVKIGSLIEFNQLAAGDFFILVRRIPSWGVWAREGDNRFVDFAGLAVHVYARDPDADEKAALVSEAVRVALRDACGTYYPGLGGLIRFRMDEEPVRRTDWATSSGPVQFADLPAGYQRYEARYSLWVRRPIWD